MQCNVFLETFMQQAATGAAIGKLQSTKPVANANSKKRKKNQKKKACARKNCVLCIE